VSIFFRFPEMALRPALLPYVLGVGGAVTVTLLLWDLPRLSMHDNNEGEAVKVTISGYVVRRLPNPCEEAMTQQLGVPEHAIELCRHTHGGSLDLVCNASLHRRRQGALRRVRECDYLGSLCDQLRALRRQANNPWTGAYRLARRAGLKYPDPKGSRPLSAADVRRLLNPPNEALAMLPLADPNTCDVRHWLGRCPIPAGLDRLIVVARAPKNRSLSWLDNVPEVPKLIYTRGHHEPNRTNYIYIPGSFGNEASVYIRFFLDCWDSLPAHTAFLHDHRSSWHNTNMDEILRRLQWGKHPYISLNLKTKGFTPSAKVEYLHGPLPNNSDHWRNLAEAWPEHFGPELGPIPEYLPGKHHCAQFVVSRENIRKRSHAFWLGLFGWLMRETMDSFWSGRCVEHTWALTLSGTTNSPITPMCDMLRCD